MPEIILTEGYRKKAIAFFKDHPQLIPIYKKTLYLLQSNPFHPSLRLHNLKGSLGSFKTVSIDMRYRVLIDFIIHENQIILLDIGDHNKIYGGEY